MNKKELQAFAREVAKGLKTEYTLRPRTSNASVFSHFTITDNVK